MLDTHQMLDANLQQNQELKLFLNEDRWRKCNNYLTLSIIGAQGTGKSTLINSMFGTSFKEKERKGFGRTTIGTNLGIIKDSKNTFMLIDSEGIGCEARLKDCKGDREEQSVFDTRLASFIFSVVDVLLVNIMVNQIGQIEASCSTLIRDIMDITDSFKIFNKISN